MPSPPMLKHHRNDGRGIVLRQTFDPKCIGDKVEKGGKYGRLPGPGQSVGRRETRRKHARVACSAELAEEAVEEGGAVEPVEDMEAFQRAVKRFGRFCEAWGHGGADEGDEQLGGRHSAACLARRGPGWGGPARGRGIGHIGSPECANDLVDAGDRILLAGVQRFGYLEFLVGEGFDAPVQTVAEAVDHGMDALRLELPVDKHAQIVLDGDGLSCHVGKVVPSGQGVAQMEVEGDEDAVILESRERRAEVTGSFLDERANGHFKRCRSLSNLLV